jgi:hypothetical protein
MMLECLKKDAQVSRVDRPGKNKKGQLPSDAVQNKGKRKKWPWNAKIVT